MHPVRVAAVEGGGGDVSDNRAAIRPQWSDPEERIRYIRNRLTKRENTPGVSWSQDDHEDIAWLCDFALEQRKRHSDEFMMDTSALYYLHSLACRAGVAKRIGLGESFNDRLKLYAALYDHHESVLERRMRIMYPDEVDE